MTHTTPPPHRPDTATPHLRAKAVSATLAIAVFLTACGETQPTPRSTGFGDTGASGSTTTIPAPTTVNDDDAVRVAVCLQATDGVVGSTIDGARTGLAGLSNIINHWVPAQPPEDAERPALELQVRPIIDHRLGSSFAEAPLIEAAVPALPAMPSVEADSAEGGVSAESQDRADRAGAQRAETISAARSWQARLQTAADSVAATSSDASELDLVGCAFAARDWLLRSPARLTVLLFVTSVEVGTQDVAHNPNATAHGLSKIDHSLMIALCPTSDRCEQVSRAWNWFTQFFIGRDEPFIARDVGAGFQQLESTINTGSQR